jgi:AraC-like DNA-binding protein
MSNNPAIKINQSPLFDGILHKQATFSDRKFPAHFHQEISIAFIEQGSEVLLVNGQKYLLPAGSIVALPAGLVHAHEGVGISAWRYHSVYVQADALNVILRPLSWSAAALPNQALCLFGEHQDLEVLFKKTLLSIENEADFAQNILEIFTLIKKNESTLPASLPIAAEQSMEDIKQYIENHWNEKITLEHLCGRFRYEKFNLLRQFKRYTGLSPIHYHLALRIEAVKKALLSAQSLTDITYEAGFYDPSHLSHCFRKYVGVAPSLYRG